MAGMSNDRRLREEAALAALSELSNWGRWGGQDERGALNTVSRDVVRSAISSVRHGRVYSLASQVAAGAPGLARLPQALHFMLRDGGDAAAAPDEEPKAALDGLLLGSIHGRMTHIDALCHRWAEDTMYNGFSGNTVRSSGALHLGIENVPGLVTRGILLDIAATLETDVLDPDHLITADEVVTCERRAGVTVQAGDAVLIRTGWIKRFTSDPVAYGGMQPGLGPSAGLYLAQRGVCLAGSDNTAVEAWSGRSQSASDPRRGLTYSLHIPFLRNLGIYLMEMLDLEELAADDVRDFLMVVAPLRITGGTGSPVNPLAIA